MTTQALVSLRTTLSDLQTARRGQQEALTAIKKTAKERSQEQQKLDAQIVERTKEQEAIAEERNILAVEIEAANAVLRQAKNGGECLRAWVRQFPRVTCLCY